MEMGPAPVVLQGEGLWLPNNLIASMLWHRVTVVVPPDNLITEIQKKLVDFFWGGYHWIKSAVLFLPVLEGGQGLIDLRSRITAFRLQTAQRFLYRTQQPWTETAYLLATWSEEPGL